MQQKWLLKAIIGFLVIGGAMAYFVYTAMQSSYSYYLSVDEFAARGDKLQNHSLRIAGTVEKDSITRDTKNMQIAFTLSGNQVKLPVRYRGVVPENFNPGREVVVEGKLTDDGTFHAKKLMTKCESKYEAKLQEEK